MNTDKHRFMKWFSFAKRKTFILICANALNPCPRKNIEIFVRCFEILKDNHAVQIFAEGEHHLNRRVLPLKKGFARIILGTLQKYPDVKIQIVPVGINYDSHLNIPASVSVYYGEPIHANQYFDINNPDYSFKDILKVVRNSLTKLTLHIEDLSTYKETIEKLEKANVNYLNPFEANRLLNNLDSLVEKPKEKRINWFLPIHLLAKINSFFPLLIWNYLKPKITDIVFTNTFRFALIATVFPLFYLLQTLVVLNLFNVTIAMSYLIVTVLIGLITVKTMPISQ